MINKKVHILLIFSVFWLYLGCNKVELPEPVEEGTLFHMIGEMNGSSFYIGIDDPQYIMVPDAALNDHGVWEMSGSLKSRNPKNQRELKVVLRNYQISSSKPGLSFRLAQGQHPNFLSDGALVEVTPLHLQVVGHEGLIIDSLQVVGVDSTALFDETTIHLEEQSHRQVKMVYSYPGDKHCSIHTHVFANTASKTVVPNWHVTESNGGSALLQVHVDEYDLSHFTEFKWNDGAFYGTSWRVSQAGWYVLEIKDTEGNIYRHRKYLHKSGNYFSTLGNELGLRAAWLDKTHIRDFIQKGSLHVEYTHSDGKCYHSSNEPIAPGSITITSISEPKVYNDHLAVIEVSLNLNLTLHAVDGSRLQLQNVSGTFALGIPY
jgi:hypothetical protein